jgi:TolB protein
MRRYSRSLAAILVGIIAATLPGVAAAATPVPPGRILINDDSPGEGVKSVRATGKDLRKLGLEVPYYAHPDYSPDRTRVAYTDNMSVYTVRADGTDRRWVVDGTSAPAFPRWSPDGSEIAFEANGIWAARTDVTAVRQVVESAGGAGYPLTVAWSPDGNQVAVVKTWVVGGDPWDPIFARDIWIVNADGSGAERRLTTRETWEPYRLSWSPDGRTIAVEAQGDVWTVRVRTGAVRNLTATADLTESSPVWSPDGRWLAYGRRDADTPTSGVWLRRVGKRGLDRPLGITGEPTSWR